jgi:hypothetical protein
MILLLVATVLDEQLRDKNGKNAGRIDGIVVTLRDGGRPPVVAFVEVSPITLIARFSRRMARWYARIDARLGGARGAPFRIPWSQLARDGPSYVMDQDVETTPINALEDWLRVKIVEHIPGA